MKNRGVLTFVADLFGLIVDGHSCRYPEPCKVVMRNIAIAVDPPTVRLGPVAPVLQFNAAKRGMIPAGLLRVPATLFVAQGAVLVAVSPDRRGCGRQKQNDRQETGQAATGGNIDFHLSSDISDLD